MRRFACIILTLLIVSLALPAPVQAQDSLPPRVYLPEIAFNDAPVWLGPTGGSPVSMVVNPKNASILYIGSWGAGVYKSTDGGANWTWSSSGIGNFFIDSLAIDPVNPDILYAGTHGAGVYKSTNAGKTWTAANNGINNPAVVYSMAVSVANHNLVFAGTRFDPNRTSPPWGGVLYRSTDGGANWTPVITGLGGNTTADGSQDWIYSIAPDPRDANRVLVAAHEHGPMLSTSGGAAGTWTLASAGITDLGGRAVLFDPRPGSTIAHYAAWHRTGAFRSTNLGLNWSQPDSEYIKVYPNAFALAPASPDRLYMGSMRDTGDTTTLSGVFRSDDTGQSWNPVWLDRNIYSLAVSPSDFDRVFAGVRLSGVYRSDNGGRTWAAYNTGLTNYQITGMVYTGGSLFASTLGTGIFRSDNGGAAWYSYNGGLGDLNVNALVVDPSNSYRLFALTQSAGLQVLNISGGGWARIASPEPEVSLEAASVENGLPLGDPLRLPDPLDGMEDEGVTAASINYSMLSIAFSASNPSIAYLGTTGGIYKSTNGGSGWGSAGLSGSTVRSVAVHPTDPSLAYAATTAVGSVMVSSNGGASWGTSSLPGLSVYAVYTTPQEPDAVYAGTSDGLWKKTGTNWTQLGLNGSQVISIAAHPSRTGVLIAGTANGAYASKNGGLTWQNMSDEITPFAVSTIIFPPGDLIHVLLGTTGRGSVQVRIP